MSNRLLNSVYHVVRNYAWWVIIISVILTISAVVYTFFITDLPMRSSFLYLLPQGDPVLGEFEKREETIKQVDSLLILLSISPPSSAKFATYSPGLDISNLREPSAEERVKKLKEEAEKIKKSLSREKEISSVSFSSDLQLPDLGLFISPQRLANLRNYIEKIRNLLTSPKLKFKEGKKIAEVYGEINNQIEETLSGKNEGKTIDPEIISEQLRKLRELNADLKASLETLPEQMGKARQEIDHVLELMSNLQEEAKTESTKNLYISKDKRSLLVSVKPRFSSQKGLEYNRKITELVKEKVAFLSPHLRGIKVGFAGPYVTMAETDHAVKTDMRNTTLISAIGIAVLFLLIFRTIYPLMVIIIPLLMGLLLTLAWAKFSVGGMNLITSFLPALILGLGVDYGIHFLTRYMEELRSGKYIKDALKTTIFKKGKATLSAALTTSCVFLILSFARSRGLFEMGIVGGVGILLSFLSMIFVLPSLIVISHLILKRKFTITSPASMIRLKSPIRWILNRRKEIVILALIGTFFVLFPAANVKFQFTSGNLIPSNLASKKTSQTIESEFNLQGTGAETGEAFIFFARTQEDMERIVKNLKQKEMVDQVVSIQSLLPDQPTGQIPLLEELEFGQEVEQKMELIEENLGEKEQITEQIKKLVKNLSSLQILATFYGQKDIGKDLSTLAKQLSQLKSSFKELNSSRMAQNLVDLKSRIGLLESRIRNLVGSTPDSRSIDSLMEILPSTLKEKFFTPQKEFIVYAYLVENKMNKKDYYQDFIKSLSEISDNFIGMSMIENRLETHMKRDFSITTIFAGLAILTILWVRFRKSGSTFILALFPLLLGYLWMLGMMKLLGITFNFANIIISPLLIGIGVDNGIHLMHRFNEEGDILKATTLAGTAIIATSLTTLLVFGNLIFAQTPGLKLLGQSALLGVGFTTLSTFLLLPALISLYKKD